MTSHVTPGFLKRFRELPPEVRRTARKNYQLWLIDPRHRSLQFKRVHRDPAFFSVRIGIGWRALALVESNHAEWFWIGSHAEYDQFLNSL